MLMCGGLFSASAQVANSAANSEGFSARPSEKYCTTTGGELENREPVYGTNNSQQQWLKLSGHEEFCQYTASDGSRIHISLATLYTKKPTLAALAYYSETPWNGQGDGNPASFYCTQLGGSDQFGGTGLAGGGWVKLNTIDEVLEACIFPDNSTIDSWGLLYHSDGIIRGINLSTVLQYQNPYAQSNQGK
jgi:putative hemolysin